jgi:hypothetical protein
MRLFFLLLLFSLSPALHHGQGYIWTNTDEFSNQQRTTSLEVFTNNDLLQAIIYKGSTQNANSNGAIIFRRNCINGDKIWVDTLKNLKSADVACDNQGNFFLAAEFNYSTQIGSTTHYPTVGNLGGIIAKFDGSGHCIWSKDFFACKIVMYNDGGFVTVGSVDNLVTRFDNNGNIIWSHAINGNSFSNDLSVDHFGNIYIAGQFNGMVTFGNVTHDTTITYSGLFFNAFVAKFDSNGDFKWVSTPNPQYGFDTNHPLSLINDDIGNVMVAGSYIHDLAYGDSTFSSPSYYSIILAKHDNSGNILWVKNISGSARIEAFQIEKGNGGNFLLAGAFSGYTQLNSNIQLVNPFNTIVAFLCNFDGTGNATNAYQTNSDCCSSIGMCIRQVGNAIYWGGFASGVTSFGSYSTQVTSYSAAFISKIAQSSITNIEITSDSKMSDSFVVYPNPTSGYVCFEDKRRTSEQHVIEIYSIHGSKLLNYYSSTDKICLELSYLPKGIYLVKIIKESLTINNIKLIVN